MTESATTPAEGRVLSVPRRSGLSYDEFVEDYLCAQRPVVLVDVLKDWKAVDDWNLSFFKREFGSRSVIAQGREITVAEFIELLVASNDETPAPYLTPIPPRSNRFLDIFPELAPDIEPVPKYLLPNWLEDRYFMPVLGRRFNRGRTPRIFFGGRGAGFPYIHWDSLHFNAFAAQLIGEKHWYLYAPDQTEFLYPRQEGANQSLVNDVLKPDLVNFPLFPKATSYQCTVGHGELLFVPGGWWHTTRILSPCISIAINSANASNWSDMSCDLIKQARQIHPLLAPPVNGYLKSVYWRKLRRDCTQNKAWATAHESTQLV